MLVLSRKSNESIVIGGSSGVERLMKLTVLGIRGRTVKLGIEVANEIPVHRWEVWERIRAGTPPENLACVTRRMPRNDGLKFGNVSSGGILPKSKDIRGDGGF